jgi:hypothetical protein
MSFSDLPYDIVKSIQSEYLLPNDRINLIYVNELNRDIFNSVVEEGFITVSASLDPNLDFNNISDIDWIELDINSGKIKSNEIKTLFVNLDLLNLQNDWDDVIPDYFLNKCKFEKIILRGNTIKTIGDNFLSNCSSLISLDLSGLNNIITINDFFLGNCSSLTSLDLSKLNDITIIRFGFLYGCSSLISLDLSGLNNVIIIGKYFLAYCSSLTSLNLSGLNNVTTINGRFLHDCSSLTSLNLSGLNNVTTISSKFLECCSSLTSLNLSGLNNVTTISQSDIVLRKLENNKLFSNFVTTIDDDSLSILNDDLIFKHIQFKNALKIEDIIS